MSADDFDVIDLDEPEGEDPAEPTQPGASEKAARLATLAAALPAGGEMILWSKGEVDLFEKTTVHLAQTFDLVEHNDLLAIGGIAQQHVEAFRAQQALNNQVAEFDADGDPTGRYITKRQSADAMKAHRSAFREAMKEIRDAEKALGIDKRTRDSAGAQNEAAYLNILKAGNREFALHISQRTLAYEAMAMDARRRVRILFNADDEDKRYNAITAESICLWLQEELAKLEEIDKEFAAEKGKVVVGRLK